MMRGVTAARTVYVAGAIGFALFAVAIAADSYGSGPVVLFSAVFPTAILTSVVSLKLISPSRIATLRAWLLAGVVVPTIAVFAFFETSNLVGRVLTGFWSQRILYWFNVEFAMIITVPLAILGHLLLRWLIKAWFDPQSAPHEAGAA